MLKESALVLAATGAAATVVYLFLNMNKATDTSKSSDAIKEEFLVLKDPSPQPTTTQETSIQSNQSSDSVEVIDFQPQAAESLEQELEAASKTSENQTSQSSTFEDKAEGSLLTTASNEDSMIIINPEDLNSSQDVHQIEFK